MARFTWTPSYGTRKTVQPRVTATKFGDGYEQRTANGINTMPRKYDLIFENKPNDVADALEAFLTARGGLESFDWMPPRETQHGRFVCRGWDVTPTSPRTRSITCSFEEVFES